MWIWRYNRSRFFISLFFMHKLSGKTLDKLHQSCRIFHNEYKKIGFVFFWIFYNFLRILQDSAKRIYYLRSGFSIRSLEVLIPLQICPWFALRPLEWLKDKQCGLGHWGRCGRPKSGGFGGGVGWGRWGGLGAHWWSVCGWSWVGSAPSRGLGGNGWCRLQECLLRRDGCTTQQGAAWVGLGEDGEGPRMVGRHWNEAQGRLGCGGHGGQWLHALGDGDVGGREGAAV
jgi:hypothetical protein